MINILHITTHNEECGIAKYKAQFLQCMMSDSGINSKIFPHSPNVMKHMTKHEFSSVLKELKRELKNYDILHIQHEISFFYQTELRSFIETARSLRKKVIVTVHTG